MRDWGIWDRGEDTLERVFSDLEYAISVPPSKFDGGYASIFHTSI